MMVVVGREGFRETRPLKPWYHSLRKNARPQRIREQNVVGFGWGAEYKVSPELIKGPR
jgi:hypothetical protein